MTSPENVTPPADRSLPAADATEAFDAAERDMWQGRTEAYAGSFARLCAPPVEALLDAAGGGRGTRGLVFGTRTGTAAAAAIARWARVNALGGVRRAAAGARVPHLEP